MNAIGCDGLSDYGHGCSACHDLFNSGTKAFSDQVWAELQKLRLSDPYLVDHVTYLGSVRIMNLIWGAK